MIPYRILLITVFLFCNAKALLFECNISLETEYQKPSEQIFAFDKAQGVLSDQLLGTVYIKENQIFLQLSDVKRIDMLPIKAVSGYLPALNRALISAVFGFVTPAGNLQFLIGDVNGKVELINKDGKPLTSHQIAPSDDYYPKVIRFHQIAPQLFCVVTKMLKVRIIRPGFDQGLRLYYNTQVSLNFIEFGCQGKGFCPDSIILPIEGQASITFRGKQICVEPAEHNDYVKITVNNHD